MMADQIPLYAPAAGVVYAKSHALWLETELGVHSIPDVTPLVITGQQVLAGTYLAIASTTSLHWEYQARRDCQYQCSPRNLAQVDVRSGTPQGRAMSSGWNLCQHCFGKLLSQWRREWMTNARMGVDWSVIVRSHLSRRPIANISFKGERSGLRVV